MTLPTEAATVLIIEDESDLRRLLRLVLERAGHVVVDAPNGRSGLRAFHEVRPDVVVLDIGLPDLDGWEVLQRIRDLSDVPVLLLTARSLEAEKVRGLRAGADDYVTKPFGRQELPARIHALLRRRAAARAEDATVLDDGHVRVDVTGREVRVNGQSVQLTPTEYRLLVALMRHAGQVLSPEQLLEQAWDDPTGIASDRVKFTVLRLRRKLGFDEPTDSPIQSVRGFGYRYCGEVH